MGKSAEDHDLAFAKSLVLAANYTLQSAPTRIAEIEEQITQLRRDQNTLRRQLDEAPEMMKRGQRMTAAFVASSRPTSMGPMTHVQKLRTRHERLKAKLGRITEQLPGDSGKPSLESDHG